MEAAKKNEKTIDSNYIQQHLANERTYLAWIRTSIAIIGIGFLITNLHYAMRTSLTEAKQLISDGIGILSVVTGITIMLGSTLDYLKKRKNINEQTFRSATGIVVLLSVCIMLIVVMIGMFFFII
ncbi:DUF202 domain-containing protein [Bacillus sp. 165]|uniref:YidH family protein n=1 Tax=Bacillus sp. 165 TaxID=1529117 RepID=UPI001ADAC156|nr:DUF202 domain-containing protein [Bacillus sp. 165]MBO9130224.1 DUF202 domain-containing protein [Bacillus sp. 165]